MCRFLEMAVYEPGWVQKQARIENGSMARCRDAYLFGPTSHVSMSAWPIAGGIKKIHEFSLTKKKEVVMIKKQNALCFRVNYSRESGESYEKTGLFPFS